MSRWRSAPRPCAPWALGAGRRSTPIRPITWEDQVLALDPFAETVCGGRSGRALRQRGTRARRAPFTHAQVPSSRCRWRSCSARRRCTSASRRRRRASPGRTRPRLGQATRCGRCRPGPTSKYHLMPMFAGELARQGGPGWRWAASLGRLGSGPARRRRASGSQTVCAAHLLAHDPGRPGGMVRFVAHWRSPPSRGTRSPGATRSRPPGPGPRIFSVIVMLMGSAASPKPSVAQALDHGGPPPLRW